MYICYNLIQYGRFVINKIFHIPRDYSSVTGYQDAKGNMLNDLKNQAGMGVPVDTKKIEGVS